MRFEVIKRDAEITCWQAIANGGNTAELKEKLHTELRQLDEDFAFIAECNEGGEFMARKIARLKAIAERTWLEHYLTASAFHTRKKNAKSVPRNLCCR
jgi:hypothetical protein